MTTPDTERALFVADCQLSIAKARRLDAWNRLRDADAFYVLRLAEQAQYEAELKRLKSQSK